MTDLVEATEVAIKAATHLTAMDDGAVEALRALARKIDAWDVIVDWALDDIAGNGRDGARPAVPQNDNVSISAYLKFCDSLGLSPIGRTKLPEPKTEGKGGKLGRLKPVPKPQSA